MTPVDELIQNMRLLPLAEVRKRLERLRTKNPEYYGAVIALFSPAKK